MRNIKRFLALALAVVMGISLIACGNVQVNNNPSTQKDPAGSTATTQTGNDTKTPAAPAAKNDEITIGSWWVQYYDSSDSVLEDDPSYSPDGDEINLKISQLKLDNVKKIEEKYGVPFYWQNLTYAGVKDSINTSIIAGTPDCDVYLVEVNFALPAQMNGLALDLRTVLPADSDIFTDKNDVSFLDFGDGKACIFYRNDAAKKVEATYPLAFNVEMLENNNLEDPRVLYERGEWTWDKFIEYCQVLTQDTDGDGQDDQFGFCGYAEDVLGLLLMSNGATIASGATETLTSPAVGETLQFLQDMYNKYNVCYPYDFSVDAEGNAIDGANTVDGMRFMYRNNNIAFWPCAAWMADSNADYDIQGKNGVTLPFDTAYVRWPVGPSGSKEANAGKNDVDGEFYIIPTGVAEPEKVYGVMTDFWNWHNNDYSLRDSYESLNWWYNVTSKTDENRVANFNCMVDCGEHATVDLWKSLNVGYQNDLQNVLRKTITPAQFQETYKQQYQDALDNIFK